MLTLRKRRVAKQADVWSGGKFGKGGGISWNPKRSFYRTGLVCFSKLYQLNEKGICVDLVDFICQKKTD